MKKINQRQKSLQPISKNLFNNSTKDLGYGTETIKAHYKSSGGGGCCCCCCCCCCGGAADLKK